MSLTESEQNLTKLREREYFNNNYDSEYIDRYSYSYLGFNCKPDGVEFKKFFTDKKVRRAIAYTIPVDDIIEVMLDGKASRQAAEISPLKKTYSL